MSVELNWGTCAQNHSQKLLFNLLCQRQVDQENENKFVLADLLHRHGGEERGGHRRGQELSTGADRPERGLRHHRQQGRMVVQGSHLHARRR